MDIIGAAISVVHTVSTIARIPSECTCENNNVKYIIYIHKLYKVSYPYMPIKIQAILHPTHRIMLLPAVDDHVALRSCAKDIR